MTARQHQQRERQERLDAMAAAVAAGTLIVRQAGEAEREQWRRERDQSKPATRRELQAIERRQTTTSCDVIDN